MVQVHSSTIDLLWKRSHQTSDGTRLELVRGEILEMVPAGGEHGLIALEIGRLIGNFVRAGRLGYVTAAETGYILATDPDTVRAPDVGFISAARAAQSITEQYVPVAPDLAVEVVSPGDSAGQIHDKVLQFLQAGTRLVWVLYPDTKTVTVHREDGSRTLRGPDTLDGGEVLPGFSVAVQELFDI